MARSRFTNSHLSGPFNSTQFTDCCGLAVLREDKNCPGCGAIVLARQVTRRHPINCGMCGQPRTRCYC